MPCVVGVVAEASAGLVADESGAEVVVDFELGVFGL